MSYRGKHGFGPRGWYHHHRQDIDNFLVTYPRLMWLKKWLQAIFENEENLQNQVTTIGDSVIEGIDTDTADITVVDEPIKEDVSFDLLAEQENIEYSKENPTIKVDVKVSEETEKVTIGKPPKTPFSYEAKNAIDVKTGEKTSKGLFVPDLLPAIEDIYDTVDGITDDALNAAVFNDLTSFGLSMTGLNYHTFFEKETGVYFAYSGTVTHVKQDPTYTGDVVAVFDKSGNLLSFITLKPLPGHVVGNILNLFVSYSKLTGNYYIEIGCDNEVAYAFMVNKDVVYSNTLNVDKNINVTEFNSIESFNTIIGSEDTSIPIDGDPTVNWYDQEVTIWNTETNDFLYGARSNFYNGSSLTEFSPEDNVTITPTTQMVGASADYNNNLVVVYATSEGQSLVFFSLSKETNSFKEMTSRVVAFPNTGGAGSTMTTYTKELGTLESLNSNSKSPTMYGVQILNQSKDSSDSDKEWSVLINHAQPGINDSSTSYVSGFGNSSISIANQLLNSDEVGINDLLSIVSGFKSQLAGISMCGEFNLARKKLYGIDMANMNDTPDRQKDLIIDGYVSASQYGVKNSKVALDRFTQEIYWSKPANNPSSSVFDGTVIVKAARRVILAIPYQGGRHAGQIGEWVVSDLNLLNSQELEVKDTNSIDMTKKGYWSQGDLTETLSSDVIISKFKDEINLPNLGGKSEVPNGTTVKTDGVWSPDYRNALNNADTTIKNLTVGLQEIVNNLYNSGAITTNNIYNFKFVTGRDIATGNINLFSNTADGTSFIRTNKGSTENDLFAG